MNYAALGAIAGTGQGIQQGVGAIIARRKEELAQRRLDAKDARDQARLDLQEQHANDANRRALMSEDMDFLIKGGRIVRNNGTEGVGFQVGKSTASTQPSEYDPDYEDVGSYDGATYQLPKDRLTPAERMKQHARKDRAAAAANLPFYKPSASETSLLDDPEQGDNILQGVLNENRFRDPAHIAAAAKSAGDIAGARFPYSGTANKAAAGAETPAQRAAANRAIAAQERTNESQSRTDMHQPKLDRKDYGYDVMWQRQKGDSVSQDSLRYERDLKEQYSARQRARLEAAQHGFSADSATKEIAHTQTPEQAAHAKLKAIYDAYLEAFHEAKTDAERAEAQRLYKSANDRALAEQGRVPAKSGGGTSF